MNNNFPDLINCEIIKRTSGLSTTLLCDGMNDLNLSVGGCMFPSIKAIDSSMKVIGTVVTVETSEGNNFPIHLATYQIPAEGYVMVIDGKGYNDRAYFGDLIMGAAQTSGYLGMIVDGYTRDYIGNIKLEFPVFSRGLMAKGPIKANCGIINGDIICGGVHVRPGDLVMGDSDGVCVVPREYIENVLEKAEQKQVYEGKRLEVIELYRKAKNDGTILPQITPQWVLDMLSDENNV